MYKIIKWEVIYGKSIWKKIWFPTANIFIDNDLEDWVYKIGWLIDGEIFSWVWTYFREKKLFEWHFFWLDKQIYSKEIEICLRYKIRENKHFKDYGDLIKQINKDIELVKSEKDYVMTFWTFDIIHPWHEYFLKKAKLHWDVLVTLISTDNNAKKFKWKQPINDSKKRAKQLKELNISDITCVWEELSTLKWLDLYAPKVVCLWYDQIWFSKELQKHIKEKKLDIKVIRIKWFKENIYKSSLIKKELEKRNIS